MRPAISAAHGLLAAAVVLTVAALAVREMLEQFPLDMGHYAYPACRK